MLSIFIPVLPLLLILAIYEIIKKGICKNKWWKIGFSVGLALTFLLILVLVAKPDTVFLDLVLDLSLPLTLFFSLVFALAFFSFGYKKILKGFWLALLSLFGFFCLLISPYTPGGIIALVLGIICFFVIILFRVPKRIKKINLKQD
ncbi:hypothetical protein KJA17_00115 [Patescibacteria group bacterium]|nr:hypothetical protein [Patescibacteria group bacterium]